MAREHDVREAVDRFLARVRQDTDKHLGALAGELLRVATGDVRTGRVDLERAAVDVSRAVARGGTYARHDLMARLIDAMRRLDEATTLRGIVDALAAGIAAEASRVAVLMADGDVLRTWGHHGYAPGELPEDVPHAAVPVLSAAVNLRQITAVPASDRPDPLRPAFMQVAPGHAGLVMPLIVANDVVAVVYADGVALAGKDRQLAPAGAPVWAEQVEVLTRHASARLENVTSQRTVAVLTGP